MANDKINHLSIEETRLKAFTERLQLEQDIKHLLDDIEKANHDDLGDLIDRLRGLRDKRKELDHT